jgi:RNase_H superfamily
VHILSVDVETRPNIVYKWDLFDKSITPNEFIVEASRIICFSAKWVGEDTQPEFWSEFRHGRERMIGMAHRLFSDADVLLHYNGQSFDEPKMNTEFISLGFDPPSPYRRVDLYRAVRAKFAFPSGKLNYVCQALEIGQKTKHEGIELWRGCMEGDPQAWAKMEEYNKHDVELNEQLYEIMLPWIPGLPSYGAEIGGNVCPGCGSQELIREGYAFTKTGKYQRFVCRSCGTWSRASRREDGTGIVQVAA